MVSGSGWCRRASTYTGSVAVAEVVGGKVVVVAGCGRNGRRVEWIGGVWMRVGIALMVVGGKIGALAGHEIHGGAGGLV